MGSYPIKNSRGVSQDPFWVLWRTAMPSVLIEIGFITNPDDLAILRTEAGREGIAQNIFKAFCTFKSRYDGSVNIAKSEETPAVAPETKPAATTGKVKYGVQVLVTSREMDPKDPFFAGYKPTMIKSGKYYKYVIGVSTSQEEVKKTFAKVQKNFPDAFIIKFTE